MGLKIHDFCAVRIRCLVIVKIICLIFFCRRLYRKDCGGESRKIFRLKPSSLRQNMVRCIYKRPHTPRRLAKRFFSSLTPMWKLPCSGLAAVEQMSCSALWIQRPQAITRMRTSGIVLLSRYKAAPTAKRLLEELYDLHDYGTLVGLARAVYDPESTGADFKAYYADEDHLSVLSLFAAYFIDDFTNRETVEMAECTAGEFVGYLLENGGLDRVIASPFSESDHNEWLRTIDVAAEYRNLYGTEFLKRCDLSGKLSVSANYASRRSSV